MQWNNPPRIKIYEALGCIADGRVSLAGDSAVVYSSSRNKHYDVSYDPAVPAIMSNDNGSYWKGYLGYPSIAFLMVKGVINYDPRCAEALKDIPWKDINQRYRNDFEKTEEHVKRIVGQRGIHAEELNSAIESIYDQIKGLRIEQLGPRTRPPEGY